MLLGVTNARAKVGSIQATPELVNDPAAFQKFQQAQGELTCALSRLLVVAENYPQLKSDQNFRDLQAQLEGTENRIAVARNRYIKAVQEYNVTVRSFPHEPDRDGVRLQGEGAVHGRERKRNLERAEGRFRHVAGACAREAAIPPGPPSQYSESVHDAGRVHSSAWSRVLLAVALLLAAASLLATCAVPPLKARVTDLTGTLTAQQQATLEQTLAAFEQRKGSQIAVLIVPTTQPETIEHTRSRRRAVEARPQGRRRRRVAADREERPQAAHRSGLRARGRAQRCDRQAHHRATTSRRASSRAISTAASTAGVDRMIKVIDGEPLPPPSRAAQSASGVRLRFGIADRLSVSCWSSSFGGLSARDFRPLSRRRRRRRHRRRVSPG